MGGALISENLLCTHSAISLRVLALFLSSLKAHIHFYLELIFPLLAIQKSYIPPSPDDFTLIIERANKLLLHIFVLDVEHRIIGDI